MADVTIAAPGKVVGNNDRLALFLKVFAGEVLAAFNGKSVTLGRHIERNISSGKSAQFPLHVAVGAAVECLGNRKAHIRPYFTVLHNAVVKLLCVVRLTVFAVKY